MVISVPPPRSATDHRRHETALDATPKTALEISSLAGLREKDVNGALERLERSLYARGQGLIVEPASYLGCGFVFRKRTRIATPSRCPVCKSERMDPPRFRRSPAP